MATEHALTDRIKCITYYGGDRQGRSYDFVDRETGMKVTFSENEMLEMMNRPTPPPIGCMFDGHHGQYIYGMVVEYAMKLGYKPTRSYMTLTDKMSGSEEMVEESNLAETWVNEHVAEQCYAFGWHDGDYFYQTAEWWEIEG